MRGNWKRLRKALTKAVKEAIAQYILGEGEAKTEQVAADPTTGGHHKSLAQESGLHSTGQEKSLNYHHHVFYLF